MSQSFANTNSLPMELSLGNSWIEGWALPKFNFNFNLFKFCSGYLRYPSPEQGMGYRAIRVAAIKVLQVRGVVQQLRKANLELESI